MVAPDARVRLGAMGILPVKTFRADVLQNRAEDDAKTHYHVAQNGRNWLLLTPSNSRKAEGCVVAFSYPNNTGWVAFFIMTAAFRGQGMGRQLWTEMESTFRANGTKIIGLDGVQEQVGTYKRRGFVDIASIPLMVRDSLKTKPLDVEADSEQAVGLHDIKNVDPNLLAKLDREHTGLDRCAYWSTEGLLSRPNSNGFAIVRGKELTGFIFVRRCELGYRFGPLYAETYVEAKQLLQRAMNETAASHETFIAEAFGSNAKGREVFEELGWTYANVSYHRMWLNGVVPEAQQENGRGTKGMYAIFDACAG